MPDIDKFDSEFFGMSDRKANSLDPQFKLCYETTFEAILDAGINPDDIKGSRTGMFTAYCYIDGRLAQLQEDIFDTNEFEWIEEYSEVSKYFGFSGPCLTYDSACASSFSALNEAFKLVRAGVIDTAIVAGIAISTKPSTAVQFRELGMTSQEGMSRCMDQKANGYVRYVSLYRDCIYFISLYRG